MADRSLFRRTEKLADSAFQHVRTLNFAFPEYESCPSVSLEQMHVIEIPLDVPVEFPVPEFTVGTGSSAPWTIVLMPEATVDENYLLVLGKYKIRSSRKIPTVQSKSESESMRDFANSNFRRCVATSYATHQPSSLDRRKVVRHVGISVCGSPLVQLYTLHWRTGGYSFRRPGGPVRCRVHLSCFKAHEIDHRANMMNVSGNFQTIRFEPRGRAGLLTLQRPERLNAIFARMMDGGTPQEPGRRLFVDLHRERGDRLVGWRGKRVSGTDVEPRAMPRAHTRPPSTHPPVRVRKSCVRTSRSKPVLFSGCAPCQPVTRQNTTRPKTEPG